jgi:ABC-2 type transport system ATP-binding protein
MELMAEHFVIIGRGRLIADVSSEQLRAMADENTVTVTADDVHVLAGLLRRDGVTITPTQRDTIAVEGLPPAEIGLVARDAGIALAQLTAHQSTLEDVFMALTLDAVQYHGAVRSTTGTDV